MSLCINTDCEKAKKQEDQGLSLFCTGCGSSLLINDLYRVIKHLGSGGFGTTYLVDDCGTPKVLKILHNTDPKAIAVYKDPVTDPGKTSKKGRLSLVKTESGYETVPTSSEDLLEVVYENGQLLQDQCLNTIRKRAWSLL